MMDNIILNVPKELTFTSSSPIKMLVLENTSLQKLIFKIRTNHKTALSINPTHGFIGPISKKQIPVKLIEVHEGVKLEVNYAKPTQKMIATNDSKMTGIDKKQIKKQVVLIKCDESLEAAQKQSKKFLVDDSFEDELMTSVYSVAQKGSVLKKPINSEALDVVEQHPEEDDEEFEEKRKKMKAEIAAINEQIEQKSKRIDKKRIAYYDQIKEQSAMQPWALGLCLVGSFIIGNLIKRIVF